MPPSIWSAFHSTGSALLKQRLSVWILRCCRDLYVKWQPSRQCFLCPCFACMTSIAIALKLRAVERCHKPARNHYWIRRRRVFTWSLTLVGASGILPQQRRGIMRKGQRGFLSHSFFSPKVCAFCVIPNTLLSCQGQSSVSKPRSSVLYALPYLFPEMNICACCFS